MFCTNYDTDLPDDQWREVRRFIPPPRWGGRPRTTSERAVLNGIFYVIKTGCHWRSLPNDFPPWQTVFRYYRLWTKKGVWRKIQYALYPKVRALEGKGPEPSAVVIDSQSVKTGKMAAVTSRGFDGGKRVKGRKRHIVVDTLGLMVDVSVTQANVHDTKGAQKVLAKMVRRQKKIGKIETVFADKGYSGANLAGWVRKKLGAVVQVGQNLTRNIKQFIPAKKRWVVERTFAWLGDYRRLVVDHERLLASSVAAIRIAFIRLMLRRLHPSATPNW